MLVEAVKAVESGESGGCFIVYCVLFIVGLVFYWALIVGRALARQSVPRALARVRYLSVENVTNVMSVMNVTNVMHDGRSIIAGFSSVPNVCLTSKIRVR